MPSINVLYVCGKDRHCFQYHLLKEGNRSEALINPFSNEAYTSNGGLLDYGNKSMG